MEGTESTARKSGHVYAQAEAHAQLHNCTRAWQIATCLQLRQFLSPGELIDGGIGGSNSSSVSRTDVIRSRNENSDRARISHSGLAPCVCGRVRGRVCAHVCRYVGRHVGRHARGHVRRPGSRGRAARSARCGSPDRAPPSPSSARSRMPRPPALLIDVSVFAEICVDVCAGLSRPLARRSRHTPAAAHVRSKRVRGVRARLCARTHLCLLQHEQQALIMTLRARPKQQQVRAVVHDRLHHL